MGRGGGGFANTAGLNEALAGWAGMEIWMGMESQEELRWLTTYEL